MFGFLCKNKTSDGPLKGYKVTNKNREKQYGIAANSLGMLKDKASRKFNIKNPLLHLAKDGTAVLEEEYFATIQAQTVFVIAEKDDDIKNDNELFYEDVLKHSPIIQSGQLIQKFLRENLHLFSNFVKEHSKVQPLEKCNLNSNKSDDAEWFIGQYDGMDKKEQVMARRAQDRVRGYFYKLKDDVTKSKYYRTNAKGREMLDSIIELFRVLLITVEYFSSYFDRKCDNKHKSLNIQSSSDDIDAPSPRKKLKQQVKHLLIDEDLFDELCISFCTDEGNFYCQGRWNNGRCEYVDHTINPYASRENAILFQMWNFDHQIEISRTIIPSLLEQVKIVVGGTSQCLVHHRKSEFISILTYFCEIFTIRNIKLVHIVCHDKSAHPITSQGHVICDQCDEYVFLTELLKITAPK